MYLTFIRPSLEYASIVWDNCTANESNNIEEVQLAALRAITGTKRGTNHQNLYMETGIEHLSTRRTRQKLILMYKIQNNLAPESLTELLPNNTNDRTHYNLRNAIDTSIPKTKTTAFHRSFYPATIKAWNALSRQTRESRTIHQFKDSITTPTINPPRYFFRSRDRKAEITHTRIRVKCSNLLEDLYDRQLSDTPMCDCGAEIEDAEHFFYRCNKYNHLREHIHDVTNKDIFELDIEELTYGNPNKSDEANAETFEIVQLYITLTGRF